jgi:hypothetical protein
MLCAQFASGIQHDTARLAADLKQLRNGKSLVMDFAEYRRIHREYLAWLDSRVKAGASASAMNVELADAHLFLELPESDVSDMLEKSCAGFLGEIASRPADPERDLLAFTFGLHTGASCGFNETLALYSRRTLQRVAWINAEDLQTDGPALRRALADGMVLTWHLRGFTVGRDDSGSGRLIGSVWVISNCTSNWNGESLRIDLLKGAALKNVLSEGVAAFNDDELRIDTAGDMMTFTYTSSVADGTAQLRPAISRYRVQGDHAIREAPLALSFGGFIDEWLTSDDTEAARWSSRQASLHHHDLAAKYRKELINWEHVAACPGPPPAREIAVTWEESKQTTVFLIGGASAAEMRILSISDKRLSSCHEIAIRDDRRSIMAEPSK